MTRSSRAEMLYKKGVLRNLPEPATLLKKDPGTGVFV